MSKIQILLLILIPTLAAIISAGAFWVGGYNFTRGSEASVSCYLVTFLSALGAFFAVLESYDT